MCCVCMCVVLVHLCILNSRLEHFQFFFFFLNFFFLVLFFFSFFCLPHRKKKKGKKMLLPAFQIYLNHRIVKKATHIFFLSHLFLQHTVTHTHTHKIKEPCLCGQVRRITCFGKKSFLLSCYK